MPLVAAGEFAATWRTVALFTIGLNTKPPASTFKDIPNHPPVSAAAEAVAIEKPNTILKKIAVLLRTSDT
jgi:hypothetical protein